MGLTPRFRSIFARLGIVAPVAATAWCASPATARADDSASCAVRRPAAEFNLLWPFIGISEMKLLLPVVGGMDQRGEVLFGAYLDYAQVVRPDAGKAFILAPIIGYRQFVAYGVHAELAAVAGVRHESHHPGDGATLNDFYVRAFPGVGYQWEGSPRFYFNVRLRLGVLVYRQTHAAEERKLAPAPDVNVGFRF